MDTDTEEAGTERLTEFERVICYDTLPRVTSKTTLGLVALYALLAVGSILATVHGVRTDDVAWTTWGTIAFAVVVVGGIVGFLGRSVLSAVRMRAALAEAQRMPDVESTFDELPSPFAGHTLVRFDQRDGGKRDITNNRGEPLYRAVVESPTQWRLENSEGRELATIQARGHSGSFSLNTGAPPEVVVIREGEETGRARRQSTLFTDHVEITGPSQPAGPLVFAAGSLFDDETLVGRIYAIRGYLYMDVRTEYLDDGLLGFFITMLR